MNNAAWGNPTRRRLNSLHRFGRRYYKASEGRRQGHDYKTQALMAACRIAGPLSYQDIREIATGFGMAEDGA